jgi:hypothetical protein
LGGALENENFSVDGFVCNMQLPLGELSCRGLSVSKAFLNRMPLAVRAYGDISCYAWSKNSGEKDLLQVLERFGFCLCNKCSLKQLSILLLDRGDGFEGYFTTRLDIR